MDIPRWQTVYEADCEESESGFPSWSANKYMQDEIDALRKRLETAVAVGNAFGKSMERIVVERDGLVAEVARITTVSDNYYALCVERHSYVQALIGLPGELQELSGCENTAGVQACIEHVNYVLAGFDVTGKEAT